LGRPANRGYFKHASIKVFIDKTILKPRLRFRLLFSRNFAGEQVPKLEDAIEECLKLDLRVFIDLKDNDTRVGFISMPILLNQPKLCAGFDSSFKDVRKVP
jgi:hypothetical protein